MGLFRRSLETQTSAASSLVRLVVGGTFLSEGIQKFLFPAALGVGRFAKIGIPSPQIMAPLVGCFEIVCGALVILGLFTRFAAIPLLVIISTAIATTKIPFFERQGFWAAAHESRVDVAMFLLLIFLIITGAGGMSLDARIASSR